MSSNGADTPSTTIRREIVEQLVDVRFYADMSPVQAKAMTDVAKYTYTVPARQETYRFFGLLVLVAGILVVLVPAFLASHPDQKTLAFLIAVVVAIIAGPSAFKSLIQFFRRS